MLRINEILIDGAEDESEEFVELINQTSHPLSLAGLELWSNRGLELVPAYGSMLDVCRQRVWLHCMLEKVIQYGDHCPP